MTHALIYLEDRHAEPPEVPEESVQVRSADYWAGETETASAVYTDRSDIAAAYEAEGVEVHPLPSGGVDATGPARYTVGEKTANGWWPVLDTETGETVDGESERSEEQAQANADALNAQL